MKRQLSFWLKCIYAAMAVLFILPVYASGTTKIKCPDGDHYIQDVEKISIKYQATKLESVLNGLAVVGLRVAAEPKILQTAAAATQRMNEYLKALIVGYNICAITAEQYQKGINQLYPRLENDARELEKIRQQILSNEKINQERFDAILKRYEQTLREFAYVSGKDIDYDRIAAIVQKEGEKIGIRLEAIMEELEGMRKQFKLMNDKLNVVSSLIEADRSNGDKSKKQAAQRLFYQGNAFAGQKDFKHAAEAYEQSSLLDPEYSYTWNNWGISLRELGKDDEAMDKYKEALKHKPKDSYASFNWANLLASLNRYPEAIEKYEMASKIYPQDADIRYNWGISLYNWGNSLFDQGNHEKAIDRYEEAVKYVPNDASIWFNYGLSLFELQRYEDAIQKYQKAVEYNPAHTSALYNWGLTLIILGVKDNDSKKFEDAKEKLKTVLKYEPKDGKAWYYYGVTLVQLGDCEKAVDKFEMAVKYEPNYPIAWLGLIECLNRLGRHAEAEEKLAEAKKLGVKLPF